MAGALFGIICFEQQVGVTAQPSAKEVIDAMTALGTLYLILKVTATVLSLWFSSRKVYRWIRRTRNKHKTHR